MNSIKNKKIILCLSILASFLLIFNACNNENEYDDSVSYQTTYKQDVLPANLENVYDNTGVIHNSNLNDIMKDIKEKYGTVNNVGRENIYNITADRLVENGFFNSKGEFMKEIPISKLNAIVDDNVNFYENIIEQLNISAEAKKILIQLFAMFKEYSEKTNDYSIYKQNIVDIEKSVMNSNSIEDIEKEQLLKAMSTARYSLYYWMNFENTILKFKRPIWKYIAVAAADLLGTLEGPAVGISASALATTIVDWNEKTPDTPQPPVSDTTKKQ